MTCLMLSHRLTMRLVKEGRRHLFMPMTMTQKILAAHAGQDEVRPGQLIMAELDGVLGNDITTPVAIREFEKAGFDNVADADLRFNLI